MKQMKSKKTALKVILSLSILAPLSSYAADFTVTTNSGSGVGSLSWAIDASNRTPGRDRILFTESLGTITLDSALPEISDSLDIEGPGASLLTIDAQGSAKEPRRIFTLSPSSSEDPMDLRQEVTISGLTLTGGNVENDPMPYGGAILVGVGRYLGLIQTHIVGNLAYAGGGLATFGDLDVYISSIHGNQALSHGGGIHDQGRLYANYSAIYDNDASGLSGLGTCGGIALVNDPDFIFRNSTIANNTALNAGGGLCLHGADGSFEHITIAGNQAPSSAGLWYSEGESSISNTIIADNIGGNCSFQSTSGATVPGGRFHSITHSLESFTDCGFSTSGSLQMANARLAWQNSLLPGQSLYVLQAGSDAIDHADSAQCIYHDQLLRTRRDDATGLCDIGAYEFGR